MNMTNTSGAFCQTAPLGQGYAVVLRRPQRVLHPALVPTMDLGLADQVRARGAVIGVFILSALVALAPGVQIPKDDLLVHRVQRTILYGIQKFAAYMIMLVTMTYDTWLFMAVGPLRSDFVCGAGGSNEGWWSERTFQQR